MKRTLARTTLLLLAALVSACSDPSGPGAVATVTVTPATATLAPGAAQPLSATTLDASGNVLSGRTVTWSTSNSTIAQVDASTGVVTAVASGQATITATSGGRSGTATITVDVAVASVTVSGAAQLSVGATLQLTATLRDAAGNVLTGRPVAWSTSNAALATVDAAGVVTGVGAGIVAITATREGRFGAATISVVQAVASVTLEPLSPSITVGGTVQLTATPRNEAGTELTPRAVSWSSSNPAVATVNGTGGVAGVSAGTAVVTATIEGKTASTTVTVTSVTVAGYAVATAPVGGVRPRSVAAGDLNGDGRIDLVTAQGESSNVSVLYRNAANTAFEAPVTYFLVPILDSDPRMVVVADVNGDGRLDVVVVDGEDGVIGVLYRNAANTDFDKVSYHIGDRPGSAAVGDLNGDGRPDIAMASSFFVPTGTEVRVLERNAANTGFDAPRPYPGGGSPRSVAMGDLNGDGRRDLVVAATGVTTVLYRNAANTGFDPPLAIGPDAANVLVADLNGDGRLDVATTDLSGTLQAHYRNAANTGFDDASYPLSGTAGPYLPAIAIGDLDGDGRMDLAVGVNSGVSLLHRNAANTGYAAPVLIPIATPAGSLQPWHSVAMGDFNADGRLDLAATDGPNNTVVLLYKLP